MADVKLNSSGGGSVTLTTPSTASNLTLTLPSASGTAATTAGTETLTNKTLTAAGSNSVEATSGPTATQLAGQRNKIINGAMMIDQRNAGASVSNGSGVTATYPTDRWSTYGAQASKFTAQQNANSVTPPSGFTNYVGVVSSSAYSVPAGEGYEIYQRIEGLNCADLAWGTANAKSVTLSFWVQSSLTGTFGGAILNAAQNRSYPFSFTISSANTWAYITLVVPGDTTGTWLGTNGIGISVQFNIGCGSSLQNTANAWASGTYYAPTGAVNVVGTNGATFYITGVQLEKGATATPFENRLYTTELALCQRYYEVGGTDYGTIFSGNVTSTNAYYSSACFKITKRASATVTTSSLAYSNFPATASSVGGTTLTGAAQLYRTANGTGAGYFVDSWTASAEL